MTMFNFFSTAKDIAHKARERRQHLARQDFTDAQDARDRKAYDDEYFQRHHNEIIEAEDA